MEEPLIPKKDKAGLSSSSEEPYEIPRSPGTDNEAAEQKLHMKSSRNLIGVFKKVFHEPEIPLEDKVILGPIDKYIYYSKNDLMSLL